MPLNILTFYYPIQSYTDALSAHDICLHLIYPIKQLAMFLERLIN